MAGSKGKPFVFHHVWKLLENSEKWKLRDQEAPPQKKGKSSSSMEDDDDDEEEGRSPTPGTTKERPDGRKKSKAAERNRAEAQALQEKIEELMRSRKEMAEKALQMKKELHEKKQQEKLARWLELKENEEKKLTEEKRKADFEERRLLLEENRMKQEMLAEENRIMMMDPSSMDVTARAYGILEEGRFYNLG